MSNILIAYFSHAGQNYFVDGFKTVKDGNTKIAANKIHQLIKSDLFEIETIKLYSQDYKACCDQAKLEQQNNELPELKNYLDSIENYDTIILAYPCWWGSMPQAVISFLNHYDFGKKKILPLCTHEGSGMGRSEIDLRKICANSEILPGLAIQGSYVASSDEKIKEWLKSYLD